MLNFCHFGKEEFFLLKTLCKNLQTTLLQLWEIANLTITYYESSSGVINALMKGLFWPLAGDSTPLLSFYFFLLRLVTASLYKIESIWHVHYSLQYILERPELLTPSPLNCVFSPSSRCYMSPSRRWHRRGGPLFWIDRHQPHSVCEILCLRLNVTHCKLLLPTLYKAIRPSSRLPENIILNLFSWKRSINK